MPGEIGYNCWVGYHRKLLINCNSTTFFIDCRHRARKLCFSSYIFLIGAVWSIRLGHLYFPRIKEWFEKCFSEVFTMLNPYGCLHFIS